MKNTKIYAALGVIFILIVGQIVYYMGPYQDTVVTLKSAEQEVDGLQEQLDKLNEDLKNIGKSKQELYELTLAIKSLENKIPEYSSVAAGHTDFFKMMQSSGFVGMEIKADPSESLKFGAENAAVQKEVLKRNYELKFVGPYAKVGQFIKDLQSSYQLSKIENLIIDNEVQKERDLYGLLFPQNYFELVEAEVKFSTYVSPQDGLKESEDTISNILYKGEGIFSNAEASLEIGEDGAIVGTNGEQTPGNINTPTEPSPKPQAVVNNKGNFKIEITDILTSGDTYRFTGPSNGDPVYAGLVSLEDAFITLTVRNDSYDVSIEDKSGRVIQNKGIAGIVNPNLSIFSRAQKIANDMPDVHIYIKNYTNQIMSVTLEGSLLENVHIYNGEEQEVGRKQTKGNIRVY